MSLEELQENRLLRSESEVTAFEAALAALAEVPNANLLPQLHLVLDDDCANYEVMFGLVHFLEAFELELQIGAFLEVLPQLDVQAPLWSKILHFRILNDDSARECYRQIISRQSEPSLSKARAILETIVEEEDGPLKDAAKSVLSAI